MAKRGADHHEAEGSRTLDDLPKDRKGIASPSNDCRPDVCQLGDHGKKWGDETNFDCPRCPFETIDRDVAIARNPRIAA